MNIFGLAVALTGAIVMASGADAKVLRYDISIPTAGTPNPANLSVTINNDFNAFISNSFAGVTVNNVNFLVEGGIGFFYNNSGDYLVIGGGLDSATSAAPDTNDFWFAIADATKPSASISALVLAQVGQGFLGLSSNESATLTVTDLTPTVPLPAALPMLLGALGGLSVIKSTRRRTQGKGQALA